MEIPGGMDVREHRENEVNPRSNTVLTIPLAPIREELIAARKAAGVSSAAFKEQKINVNYVEDSSVTGRRITVGKLLRLCRLYYPEYPVTHAFKLRDKALGIKEEE